MARPYWHTDNERVPIVQKLFKIHDEHVLYLSHSSSWTSAIFAMLSAKTHLAIIVPFYSVREVFGRCREEFGGKNARDSIHGRTTTALSDILIL